MVVNVGSADIMASLVSLKKEVEEKTGIPMKLTFAGATEAHLIADELSAAGVGVIVTPTRSYVSILVPCFHRERLSAHIYIHCTQFQPYTWDERRM